MSVAKIWNGAAWIPVQGGVGRDEFNTRVGALEARRILDFQRITGTGSTYIALVSGQLLYADTAKTVPLRLSYTPPVDAWWELNLFIGTLQKTDAAYHYAQVQLGLNTADVDGLTTATVTKTQHAQVQQFEPHQLIRTYKLAAGVPYQTNCSIGVSGGTWQFNQSNNMLFLEAKAWAR